MWHDVGRCERMKICTPKQEDEEGGDDDDGLSGHTLTLTQPSNPQVSPSVSISYTTPTHERLVFHRGVDELKQDYMQSSIRGHWPARSGGASERGREKVRG